MAAVERYFVQDRLKANHACFMRLCRPVYEVLNEEVEVVMVATFLYLLGVRYVVLIDEVLLITHRQKHLLEMSGAILLQFTLHLRVETWVIIA